MILDSAASPPTAPRHYCSPASTKCPRSCVSRGGEVRHIAFVTATPAVPAILAHLGEPAGRKNVRSWLRRMSGPGRSRPDKGNDASAVAATVLQVVPRSHARTHLLWCPGPGIWAAEVHRLVRWGRVE